MSEVSILRSPHATTCLWDKSMDSSMEHRSVIEEEGVLGGRYKQPNEKWDKEDLNELMDNQRAST